MRYSKFFIVIVFCSVSIMALCQDINIPSSKKKIVANNRILAKVNGKVISVVDVMKKMDMLFYRQYPEYLNSQDARFQFYQTKWRAILEDLINRELVLADAEEKKMEVPSGEVRQEMEEIFGPNVMINLDNAGLSFQEAWKMVHADIVIRRLLLYQVRQKVMAQITPKEIELAYEKKMQNAKKEEEWSWRVISFRSKDMQKAQNTADTAYKLLTEGTVPLDLLQETLQKRMLLPEDVSLTITQSYTQAKHEITQAIQDVLETLPIGSYTQPLIQKTRSEQTPVIRVYFLEKKEESSVGSLDTVEDELRDQLAQEKMSEQTSAYFSQLRNHFDVKREQIDEDLPPRFEPFLFR